MIKMFHATLVLLFFLSILANGQDFNGDLNEEQPDGDNSSDKEEGGADKGDDDVVEDDIGDDADGSNANTTNAATAVTSPSMSTTSGGSAIFSTKTLVFKIMLPLIFFHA